VLTPQSGESTVLNRLLPQVHRQNLLHLAATLRGEITRKRLQIRMWSRENFVKILETIIKTVASIILELIKKK